MNDNELLALRTRLYALRKEKRLSRLALSKISGVNADSINRYENGTRNPRIEQLRMLADALEVPTAYLLGYANEDGSVADLGLGEIAIKKLGYTASAAKALSHQIALEAQSKREDKTASECSQISTSPQGHTSMAFTTEAAKAEAELVEKARLICKSVPMPDNGKKGGDAVSAVRVRVVTRFIETNAETLKVLITSTDDN